MTKMVECCQHGAQPMSFVCAHIVDGLRAKKGRGFIWSRDDDNLINAWCDDCDDMLESEFGGEWENVPKERYEVAIMCEPCAIQSASLNGVEISQ